MVIGQILFGQVNAINDILIVSEKNLNHGSFCIILRVKKKPWLINVRIFLSIRNFRFIDLKNY